jgi:cytochrome bd ubiquinol oxidase subunit I
VTGTILSFELGLLWPNFMATFGEVFGFAFALEGISFFVEAIFIAIYVYGWDRLSRRAHLLTGIPIVVAGITGSLFVISVNGWMNHPTGFRIEGGEVVDVSPLDALFNSHLPYELVHMYLAGIIVAGFLVAGVYAREWLRGRRGRYHRTALVVPLTFAALAATVQPVVGDWAARTVAEDQPVKLAAFEGLEHTEEGAPIDVGGVVEIPKLLSLLAFHDPDATVKGLDTVPERDRPPDTITHISFEVMVIAGSALAALAALHLLTWWRRRRLPGSIWFHRAVIAAGPLALLALLAGWVTTEVGRQPWVVYGVMRTEEAVTGLDGIPVGYAFLAVTYLALGAMVAFLLRRLARQPLEIET